MMFTIHFIECHLAITQQRSRETLLNNNQQRQNEREEKKLTQRLRPVMLLKQDVINGLL